MRASFVFSEVFTGLRRNVTMTIAMILTTAISLLMLGAGIFLVKSVDLTKDNYLDELEVAIFLNEDVSSNDQGCTQEACEGVKQALEQHPDVDSWGYINQEQAFAEAEQLFEDQPEIIDAVSQDAFPASFKVTLHDPQRSDAVVQEFQDREGVHRIHDGGDVVDKVVNALNFFRNAAFGGAVLLLGAALLLIANMIQISAYTRRTEVGIMRLVGATRWYTQLPFLLEAMVAGVLGAVLAIGGLLGLQSMIPSIGTLRFPPTMYTALVISPILLLTSMAISAVVGYVTLRLYVRH